ncbi:hypothetical protein AYI70_g6926 [Smittium culicis]|uniref:Uncharacterized protein n=1 Tax=Smittium culicis TaxID=133412 RepID=A0A1R1XMT4_9FUNG|nr:hypothetical protein AYI70_g6926 [Smittium culicis]
MEIDNAIRMVANVGKSAAMERIRDELGISSVFMRTSTARERAYHKWPTSKTWIADLIKAPMKARMTTWVTGSARYVSGPEAEPSGHWENAYGHIPDCPAPVEHENRRPKIQKFLPLLQHLCA